MFEGALKLGAALTLPLAVGAAVLAYRFIDLLYGSDFEDGAVPLMLLAPTIFLYPPTYIAAYVLIFSGPAVGARLGVRLGGVVNIGFNLVLIPAYSLDGAAS